MLSKFVTLLPLLPPPPAIDNVFHGLFVSVFIYFIELGGVSVECFGNDFFLFKVPVERRTLPTDLPGPSRRRPFTKRHSPSTEACSSSGSGGGVIGSVATSSGMQTSCSLPETPVFARGSDIPRTPQHGGNPTQPRRQPGWYAPTTVTTG